MMSVADKMENGSFFKTTSVKEFTGTLPGINHSTEVLALDNNVRYVLLFGISLTMEAGTRPTHLAGMNDSLSSHQALA